MTATAIRTKEASRRRPVSRVTPPPGKRVIATGLNQNFDHSKTKYPLLGKHQTVACGACHANGDFKKRVASCPVRRTIQRPGDLPFELGQVLKVNGLTRSLHGQFLDPIMSYR